MTAVAFLVNGSEESAMGVRARAFAARLAGRYDVRLDYRRPNKVAGIFAFLRFLRRNAPALVYVFDMAYTGVLAAALYKLISGRPVVIETGDAIYELARSTGRGAAGLWLTRALEEFSLRAADRVVVRGTFHQRLLAERGVASDVIQDGVDTTSFKPKRSDELRRLYGLDGLLTVGLVGSSVWSERLRMCYGWELVEAVRLLKDEPVAGVMIGSGTGIERLKERCREYGIEDRVRFFPHTSYEQLPDYIGMCDVCLSTQTNDTPGSVRTTGKLPLYLSCGRFVLAADVGEAALVLDREMLVRYDGVKDDSYPQRLAARITSLLRDRERLAGARRNAAIAREHFDYEVLAGSVARVIEARLKKQPV